MKKIIPYIFVILLLLPTIFLDWNNFFEEERKNIIEKYDENFAFRDELIAMNSIIDDFFFKSSPNQEVVIGKDDWLYLASSLSPRTISSNESQEITNFLLEIESSFKVKGQKFVFFIAPDKKSIYSEFLPLKFRFSSYPNYQILKEELENTTLNYFSLKSLYLREKENELLYSKLDTHWNRYGAFLAFEKVLESFRLKSPQIVSLGKYERSGDLSRMIGLNESEMTILVNLESSKNKYGSVFLIGDSFGEGMKRFFEVSFKNQNWQHINETCLEDFLAIDEDYVVLEVVERDIPNLLNLSKPCSSG